MRRFTFAAVAAAALLGSAANAATFIIDFDDGTAPGFSGDYGLFVTGVGGVAAAPNSTPFLAIPGTVQTTGIATYAAPGTITSFIFDWGTPDNYNTLAFYSGDTLVTSFTGTSLAAGTYNYTFAESDNVDNIRFTSTGPAFEIDNLTIVTAAVPEPAAWALLIAGFTMVGFASRRRMRTVTA